MRDVFTYILTDVEESGAAETWTSLITNRPTKRNHSPSQPRNGEGRLDEESTANGEGEGEEESLPRKDEEDSRNFGGRGVGGITARSKRWPRRF